MKATDLSILNDLTINPDEGIITFHNNRFVGFDVNAIGLLRQSIIDDFGLEKAREYLLKMGFEQGYSDFIQVKAVHGSKFDSETELLASGPIIHTWGGAAQSTTTEIRFDRSSGEFYFSGIWKNSYEVDQHLSYNEIGVDPVCWTLAGYMSGWCTAFFGKPLVAIETTCVGKGDSHCEWKVKPLDDWGPKAAVYVQALRIYFDKISSS
jgi:hypothetical protein